MRNIPGEIILSHEDININEECEKSLVEVTNTGDRTINLGSHLLFSSANEYLYFNDHEFDGTLDIPSGDSIIFAPGTVKVLAFIKSHSS